MKKLNSCDLCSGKNFKKKYSLRDRMYSELYKEYDIVQCEKCGLIFINPQPSYAELAKHYPRDNYYSIKRIKELPIIKKLYDIYYFGKKNLFLRTIFFPFKQLIRTVSIVPGGNYLDIGCGNGDFIIKMKKNMECYGIEPGDFDEKFAKKNGLNITHKDLKDAKFKNNYFDTITMNHVFEHVNNPKDTLKEIHRILKPDGTVIIGIPQTSSMAFKIFGRYWAALETPRHLFLYSIENMKDYAKKTGFTIKKIRYNSTPQIQFIGSLLYFTNIFRKKNIFLSEQNITSNKILFFVFLPFSTLANIFHTGDCIEVILTK